MNNTKEVAGQAANLTVRKQAVGPKWTPGPWRTAVTDSTQVLANDRQEVCVMQGNYIDGYAEMEANARLIALAPDMAKGLALIIPLLAKAMSNAGLEEGEADAADSYIADARALLKKLEA